MCKTCICILYLSIVFVSLMWFSYVCVVYKSRISISNVSLVFLPRAPGYRAGARQQLHVGMTLYQNGLPLSSLLSFLSFLPLASFILRRSYVYWNGERKCAVSRPVRIILNLWVTENKEQDPVSHIKSSSSQNRAAGHSENECQTDFFSTGVLLVYKPIPFSTRHAFTNSIHFARCLSRIRYPILSLFSLFTQSFVNPWAPHFNPCPHTPDYTKASLLWPYSSIFRRPTSTIFSSLGLLYIHEPLTPIPVPIHSTTHQGFTSMAILLNISQLTHVWEGFRSSEHFHE